MTIARTSSLRGVAFAVCTALHRGGIKAVLTGGSAATVYAPRAYQSNDIDFVVTFHKGTSDARQIVDALGYRQVGDHYEHPRNTLILEFPPGPLAIGSDLVRGWNTLRQRGMILHIITPTDSCRDRLAGFLFWNDRGSLEQAVAVARARRRVVDLNIIQEWCGFEGKADEFQEFERALAT